MKRFRFAALVVSAAAAAPLGLLACSVEPEAESDEELVEESDSALAADADACGDRRVVVTTSSTACIGEIRCFCIDNTGRSRVTGPLAPGDQCAAAPNEACSTFSVDPTTMCGAAEATTPDPVCPAGCQPNGRPTLSSQPGPTCCTATKSLECCCPDAKPAADATED
jgi:hypothetical protein